MNISKRSHSSSAYVTTNIDLAESQGPN